MSKHKHRRVAPMSNPLDGLVAGIPMPEPAPVSVIQPTPVAPAAPPPEPAPEQNLGIADVVAQLAPPELPAIDQKLAEHGLVRATVANFLRGQAMPYPGWQVDFVVWGDPLVAAFVHETGAGVQVTFPVAGFPTDEMKAEINEKLAARGDDTRG